MTPNACVNNGILLSPNYDALFDRHLISFSDDGQIITTAELVQKELISSLGISGHEKIKVFEGMKAVERHKERIFDDKSCIGLHLQLARPCVSLNETTLSRTRMWGSQEGKLRAMKPRKATVLRVNRRA